MSTTAYHDGQVWYSWTASTASCDSTVSATTSGGTIWTDWVFVNYETCPTTAGTVTTNNSNEVVWYDWHNSQTIVYEQKIIKREETAKELAERVRRQEEAKARAEKLEADKKAAEEKAKGLLLDLIGEDELKVYEETGRLFVKGRKFDYIVNKGGYVQKVDKNKIIDLCVHIQNRFTYPETDNVVGMKLAIEGNEEEFLKIANHHSPRDIGELPRAACM